MSMSREDFALITRTLGPVLRDLVDRVVEEKIAARLSPPSTPARLKPHVRAAGTYVLGLAYRRGDAVSCGGDDFVAIVDNPTMPPDHDQLAYEWRRLE